MNPHTCTVTDITGGFEEGLFTISDQLQLLAAVPLVSEKFWSKIAEKPKRSKVQDLLLVDVL
uniref:Uncharacterized protein n=1 Tax=Anopheles funestus TaxID=62324 RepID=A0A182S2H0_ANOFN